MTARGRAILLSGGARGLKAGGKAAVQGAQPCLCCGAGDTGCCNVAVQPWDDNGRGGQCFGESWRNAIIAPTRPVPSYEGHSGSASTTIIGWLPCDYVGGEWVNQPDSCLDQIQQYCVDMDFLYGDQFDGCCTAEVSGEGRITGTITISGHGAPYDGVKTVDLPCCLNLHPSSVYDYLCKDTGGHNSHFYGFGVTYRTTQGCMMPDGTPRIEEYTCLPDHLDERLKVRIWIDLVHPGAKFTSCGPPFPHPTQSLMSRHEGASCQLEWPPWRASVWIEYGFTNPGASSKYQCEDSENCPEWGWSDAYGTMSAQYERDEDHTACTQCAPPLIGDGFSLSVTPYLTVRATNTGGDGSCNGTFLCDLPDP